MSTNTSSLHVFEILRIVSERGIPMGIADVVRETSLPTSTVYRALLTLTEARYLSRDDSAATYRAGEMPLILLRALFNRFPIKEAAWPVLKELAAETGESVMLSMRIGWYAVRVASAPGNKDTRYKARVGLSQLLHTATDAKMVLASLSDDEVHAYRKFVSRNHPALVCELETSTFTADLKALRKQGFAVSPASLGNGFEVAIPLRGADREIGAMLVSGPAVSSQADARIHGWLAKRDALHKAIAADPARYRSPFAHLHPDEILLRAHT